MNQPERIQIGDHVYLIGKLESSVGLRVAARLANALAPSLKALPEEGFKLQSTEQMVAFLEPLLSNPELGDTLAYLCETFAARTFVLGGTADKPTQKQLSEVFDLHFQDSYDHLILWLGHALRVSMTSFFRGVRGLGELFPLAGIGKSDSKSPS